MQTSVSVDVQAPRERVFAFVDEPGNLALWIEGLVDQGTIEEREGRVGSKMWQIYEERGRKMRMEGEVTAWERDRLLRIHLTGTGFDMDVHYDFEDLDGSATRVTQTAEVRFRGLFRVLGWIFGRKFREQGRRKVEQDFARLKACIEGGAGGAPAGAADGSRAAHGAQEQGAPAEKSRESD